MTAKRFKPDDFDSEVEMWELLNIQAEVILDLENENKQLKTDNGAFIQDIEVFKEENTHLKLENRELKQYKDAIMNWDSSKIIRVNKNTGEVDLVDKELEE